MNQSYFSIHSISKTFIIAGIFSVFMFAAASAQAAPQITVKNETNPSYSAGSTFASDVRAEPGDTLIFQMFGNSTSASSFIVTLPADLSYSSDTTDLTITPSASANASGQTITWNFTTNSFQVIQFRAGVVSGSSLGTNHSLSISFTTDGAVSSNSATITTGPIVMGVTPSTGNNLNAVAITALNGHGFTGATKVVLSLDGTTADLTFSDLSGTTITDTSITDAGGTELRVPASFASGSYWVLVTVTTSSTELTTNSDATETVQYTATDGIPPQMTTGSNSYVHETGILTLNFDETIDVSATNTTKITLADASSGGNSLTLDSATVSTTDSAAVTFTLAQADINTISTWGQSANTLYVHINGDSIYDLSANPLSNQGSRTALDTWTEDTTQPTAAITYTQNSATTTSVQPGAVTITVTFDEPIATTPQIAIDQQGTTDIAATNLTGSGTTWTYTYTVVLDDGAAYLDGAATITISNASDYAGNALATTSNATLTIDTLIPSPEISNLSAAANGQTAVTFTWTPTYTASDFSTYKFYWSTSTGVTSANGTEITSATSGYSDLGTAGTNTLVLSGLSAGTNYYAVIYICDTADNCSIVSNEATTQTNQNAIITAPIATGGGGGGGGSSAPTVTSSAKTVSDSGGSLSTTLPSGSITTVTVSEGTFTDSTTISVSEATSSQIADSTLSDSIGTIIGESIVSIVANSSGVAVTEFSQPITLSFTYTASQLGSNNTSTLRVAYFDETTDEWVAIASTIDSTNQIVSALVDHFTLFSLISFLNPPTEAQEGIIEFPEEQPGQILGSSVGVYPNGTLLKAPETSAVWYISGGEKHLILSSAIFESQFNWNDIIELPSARQLDLYAAGTDVTFAVTTLVKEIGEPAVYRVSLAGSVQPILSEKIFLTRGYSFSEVIEVEAGSLNTYLVHAVIDSADSILSGDLVKLVDEPGVYYIEYGQARLVPSADIFQERAFKFGNIRTISEEKFASLAPGADMTYPDGTLVKGDSSAVYVISDGSRRPIVSGSDFEALLYSWDNVVYVPNTLLAAIPESASLTLVQEDFTVAVDLFE